MKYVRPNTLAEALAIMERFGPKAKPFAGGTDMMIRIRNGNIAPNMVVDIKGIAEIGDTVTEIMDTVVIGARVVMTDLVQNGTIRSFFPALVDAASVVGSVQIRNRATVAGNVCNASPAADTVPVLLTYNASVKIVGPAGNRTVPLRDFFLNPGTTACGANELVVSIDLPKPEPASGGAFGRLARRHGVDLATINMASVVGSDGTVRFAFGAVGPTPIVVEESDGRLANPTITAKERDNILAELVAQTHPISDVRASAEYRSAMTLVLARRVLAHALRRRAENE